MRSPPPHPPDRQSIRLRGFDYTSSATHFVTICVEDRQCVLGNITNGIMHASPLGKIVADCWMTIPRIRPYVSLNEWIVMPNHIHGILTIMDHDRDSSPIWRVPYVSKQRTMTRRASHGDAPTCVAPTARLQPHSLGSIIGQFKIVTTKRIRAAGFADFAWQRNYFERIVRDDRAMENIRSYIRNNPAQWERDRNNR